MAVDKNKVTAEATKLIQKGQYDKAIRAYEKILADDPKDVRFLLKIGELQQKKGDQRAAAETFGRVADAYGEQGFFLKAVAVYKQMLKLAPDDLRVNERLAALYQQLGLLSEAMAQLNVISAAAERTGDDAKLLEVLRRMTDLDPENVGSAVKLGELYARQANTAMALQQLRRAADQLKRTARTDEYVKVAERMTFLAPDDHRLTRELAGILLARGDTKRALAKLQLLFKQDPKDVETLNLLAQAFQDLGQVAKMVSVYKELAQVHAEGGRTDESRAAWRRVLDLAPDDADAARAVSPPPAAARPPPRQAAPPQPAPPPPSRPREAARAGAPAASSPAPAEAAAQPGASLDAIPKLLTETDVYVKYGLHDKALEHLERVFAIDPDHLEAREKALRVRAERGDAAGAAEEAIRVARLAGSRGLEERARAAVARLRELSPGHPALAELARGAEPAAGGMAPAAEDGLVLEIEPPSLEGDDVALAAAASPVEDGIVEERSAGAAPPPLGAPTEGVVELEEAEALSEELVIEEDWAIPPPDVARTEVEAPEQAPAPLPDLVVEVQPVDGPSAAGVPPELEVAVAQPDAEEPGIEDELAEVDFFLQQGLLDDARALLSDLLAAYPAHPMLGERLEALAAAEARPAAEDAALEAPPAESAAVRPPAPPRPAPGGGADYLYSVEDVFGRFKQQVAETIDPADAATHYDLGIAYKEMGLLDDALRELEVALAAGGRSRELDCLTMIGLCRMEKGDPGGAVEAYRRALRSGAVPPDALTAVQYQLASAYAEAGDREAALHYLHRVLQGDAGYRDARAMVARLGGGPGRPPAGDEPPPRPGPPAASPPGGGGSTGSR